MELGTGAFAGLTNGLVRLLVQAASAVVLVVLGWKFLSVLLTGGSERAIKGLLVSLVIIGVCVAALANLQGTAGIVLLVGQAVWNALGEAVRGSV
jgi:hypothetical protein